MSPAGKVTFTEEELKSKPPEAMVYHMEGYNAG